MRKKKKKQTTTVVRCLSCNSHLGLEMDHVQGRNRQHGPALRGFPGEIPFQMPMLLTLSFPTSLLRERHIRGHPAPSQQLVPSWPRDGVETYTAPLHQHPNKDALGRPQHILRRVRTCLLDAFPKQLLLPSFWAPGKPHAAELPSAKGDRVERAAGQDRSWGAR